MFFFKQGCTFSLTTQLEIIQGNLELNVCNFYFFLPCAGLEDRQPLKISQAVVGCNTSKENLIRPSFKKLNSNNNLNLH